ncbi:MAG: hypothetical protein A2W23_06980 [Planctomycetes bacterium RBG_16_43_13]|nr:MAG: hypothetical protein A2W23_06980 [Planctomycetes bacterium RBG_16_43_13]
MEETACGITFKMQKITYYIFLFIALFTVLSLSPGHAYVFTPENPSPGPDSIYLSYNAGQSMGSTLAVDVRINSLSETTPAFGAVFDMDFDSTVLTYDGLIPGNFFEGSDEPLNGSVVRLARLQSGTSNKLIVGVSQNAGDPGASGSGVILTLKFTVNSSPQTQQSDIAFSNMNLIRPLGSLIENLNWYKGQLVQNPLAITTNSLPDATQGGVFSTTLSPTGGFPPYSWRATGNKVPGLTLNTGTGEISGVPSASGLYGITVYLVDSELQEVTQDLTLLINPPPEILTTSLPEATIEQPYSQSLSGTGGTAPLTWGITTGSLPPGIILNSATGALSGTPTASGIYPFTIRLMDSNAVSLNKELSITVNTGLVITTSSLPETTVSAAYSATLQADGGTTPYTWDIPVGLPPGIELVPDTGELVGIPSVAGHWQFTVTVLDVYGSSSTKALEILVNPVPDIINSNVNNVYEGTSGITVTFTVAGGVAPYTWNVLTGSLPPGFVLDIYGGTISGTPTTPGIYNFTLEVTDATGVKSSKLYAWAILATPPGNIDFTTPGSVDRVDGYDLIALEIVKGTTVDSPLWNPLADLNGDWVINDADLTILQENFGLSKAR